MLTVILSTILMIILHHSILNNYTQWFSRYLCGYIFSVVNSGLLSLLYLFTYLYKPIVLEQSFSYWGEFLMGCHTGYYISDLWEVILLGDKTYIFHHTFSIYFIILAYLQDFMGYFMIAMFAVEVSAFIVNLRYLHYKFCGPFENWVDRLLLGIYFITRIPYVGFALIYKYHHMQLPEVWISYQIMLCEIVYIVMSTIWNVKYIQQHQTMSQSHS